MDIILASQSPRRQELLERMGLRDFRIAVPGTDETVDSYLPPAQVVQELSRRKALAVRKQADGQALIIAADTVVTLDGAVLGKPKDEPDAFHMLTMLSGCRHQVYSGLTVLRGEEIQTVCEVTDVTFRELDSREIAAYIETGEPMDKAGAYGIQGFGALFVERISGDYYNVMGLPVCRLGRILARFGVDCIALAAGD